MKKTICILLASIPVLAETTELQSVVVQAKASPSGNYEISEEDAAKIGSVTLQDKLEQDVSFSNVLTEGALSFRGLSYKATEYVENGIPLYRNVNGSIDTKSYMNEVSLQVNDGSGASSFGVSPMGGEVILEAKRPDKPLNTQLKSTISTNDEYYYTYVGSRMDNIYVQADASFYHRSDYHLSDRFETTTLQNDRKRKNSDMQQHNASLKSGIYITDEFHMAVQAKTVSSKYGIPANVYADQEIPVVWDAYTRMDRQDLNSIYFYADYETDTIELNLRSYYDTYVDVWTIYDDPSYQSAWPAMTYDDSRAGTIMKGSMQNGMHKSTIVAQFERNEHNAREEGAVSDPRFVLDTYKGSVLHDWHINTALQFEGAVSYTLLKEKESAYASILKPADDKVVWDGLAKLSYTDNESTFYGSIAKKSRMPSMNEMFTFFPWEVSNPSLAPERSMQYSLAFEQMVGDASLMEFVLYYYDISDLIIYRNNRYINREEAENYGADVRIENQSFDRHDIRFSYAYTHARDSEDEHLELIPQHRIKIEDTITLTPDWKGYLNYQYIGSRYSQNTATYTDEQKKLDAYHLANAQIIYEGLNQTIFRIGIKNLLDQNYEWQYGYPTEGRSVYVSLEWKL